MFTRLKSIYYFFSNNIYLKLLYLFCSFIFITSVALIPNINILTSICIFWGISLIPITLFRTLKYKSYNYIFQIFIYIFLAITVLLTFIEYPDLENIKILTINSMILIVFFSIDVFKTSKTLLKELNLLSTFFVLISSILSITSLTLIIFNKIITSTSTISSDSNEVIHTYIGLFHNGNALGISAGISILFSIYLFFATKNKIVKYLLFLNSLIQFVTMIISEGRSSFIFLIIFPFTLLFIKLKNFLPRLAFLAGTSLIGLAIIFSSTNNIHDIFTGRQNIWKAAFTLIQNYPIVGVGYSNLIPMIDSVRDTWLYGVEFGGLHNIYIEIFTVNGLLSGFIFLLVILFIFTWILKKIDTLSDFNLFKYTTLFSLILGIALINLFESNLIYTVSFISIVFWSICGYLIAILSKNDFE